MERRTTRRYFGRTSPATLSRNRARLVYEPRAPAASSWRVAVSGGALAQRTTPGFPQVWPAFFRVDAYEEQPSALDDEHVRGRGGRCDRSTGEILGAECERQPVH